MNNVIIKTISPTAAIKPLVVATAVLSLTACSTLTKTFENRIPPSQQPNQVLAEPNLPINQPYQLTAMDNKTVSQANQPSVAAERWQDYYSDPKLKALISIALQNNKDLESAILAVKSAEAQYQITQISNIPRANITGGANRLATNARDKNSSSAFNVNLGMANYEFDFWGKIANLKDQALQTYLGTTAAKDAAQISLISTIAQTYVNYSYALAQLQLAESTVNSRQKSLQITKARFNAGIDSKAPSLQAESLLQNAKLAAYNAQTSLLQLRNAMQYLIGSPVPEDLYPAPHVSNITNHKIFSAGLPSELLYYRPDVLQAEYKLKAAGANIAVARANYFPSISLTGRMGYSSTNLKQLFKTSAFGWSFGPSISVPLFDAGQLDANYQVAQIAQKQALTGYEKSIQAAFKEVADVLAARATLEERLETQYRLQDNFQQMYTIADARYKAGLDSYLSVLDAQRSEFSSQQSILNLEKAKAMSQVQLYQALGGGVTIDMPVTLTVPNHKKPVDFIAPKAPYYTSDKKPIENHGNPARLSSTAKVGTVEQVNQLK